MSEKTPKPKLGSTFSRIKHGIRNTKGEVKDFFGNKTRTKTQKLKNVGKGYLNSTKKSFTNILRTNKTTLEKFGNGAAGVGKVIIGAPVALGAAAIGSATTALGGITRGVAPLVGTGVGAIGGILKGSLETGLRAPYSVVKALYHSPTAAYRGIKYSLAKEAFQRRTGVSNRTESNIKTLEAKKSKAESNLEELIKKQDQKLEKIKPGDTKTVERKLAKYEAQREKLTAEIATKEANLQEKTRKKLNKTRSSKAKRGETTQFTLNATKREKLNGEAIAKRFGVLKKSGEDNAAFQDRLTFTEPDSVKDYSKRTGIKMFKGESENAYKSRVGLAAETNEAYRVRIGVKKKEGESNNDYQKRLNSYKKKEGENNTTYLKRRLKDQYELQKDAYNTAITKDVKAKQEKLKGEIGEQQTALNQSESKLKTAQNTINEYKAKKNPSLENRQGYLAAISARSKAASDKRLQELVIAQKNKKLLEAQAEENRLINTKGLNAKRGSMERRRTRLENSKQNLVKAGKHFISPGASILYGAKTGAQVGTTIGQQALKYGSFGMIKENISSNSGKGIRKSLNKFRDLGLGTNKKQNKYKEVENKVNKQKKANVLKRNIESKKTIKKKNQNDLKNLAKNLNGYLNNIKTVRIPTLEKLKTDNPNLPISEKIKIDDLISQLREKSKKYEKALLRVKKRLPAENFRSVKDNPSQTQTQSNLKRYFNPPPKNITLMFNKSNQKKLDTDA